MMDFKQAEDRFKKLKAQFEAGTIPEAEFRVQLEDLMVQDEQGLWWMIGYETEKWYQHNGKEWVQSVAPNKISKKISHIQSSDHEITEIRNRNFYIREVTAKFLSLTSQRTPLLLITTLFVSLLLIGGYSMSKNLAQGTLHTSSATEKSTSTTTSTSINSATPTNRPSQTPKPPSTPEIESNVLINANQAQMYQGPGLGYFTVERALYTKEETLTVRARDPSGFWFLCEASDGTIGWLYRDWLKLSFDPLEIPTASSIPPVPPTPTRKPKQAPGGGGGWGG